MTSDDSAPILFVVFVKVGSRLTYKHLLRISTQKLLPGHHGWLNVFPYVPVEGTSIEMQISARIANAALPKEVY